MRRLDILLLTFTALLWCCGLSATVARPDPFKYTQPDGSVVTVQLHGDEFCHWYTMDGAEAVRGDDGFFRVAPAGNGFQRRSQAAKSVFARRSAPEVKRTMTYGSPHFLILLIEFSDVHFSSATPGADFSNLLNQNGYSANGGTGSVKDYYYDNSCGAFDPIFDVVGPIRLDRSCSYYGSDDVRSSEALYDACQKIDDAVDFSTYDYDSDGNVDNVFFFFAGYNEAEGGGVGTIWPHSWDLCYFDCICDGTRIWHYACTSEFRGNGGRQMCGIGTFCHEFGHVLGLPDFYDTDYGTNGQAFTLDNFSLMSSGNYNNEGRTPPFLNAMERVILGWMREPALVTEPGQLEIGPVSDNAAYQIPTSMVGETFVIETRTNDSWDRYIAPGLLIYHLDRSDRSVHGITAKERWLSGWDINIYADHPCFYIVKASERGYGAIPFPGDDHVTSFSATSQPACVNWDGIFSGYELHDIGFDGQKSTVRLTIDQSGRFCGSVMLMDGTPVVGAVVSVNAIVPSSVMSASSSAPAALSRSMKASQSSSEAYTKTDESGNYVIHYDIIPGRSYEVVVTAEGYVSQSAVVTASSFLVRADFVLQSVFSDSSSLQKYGEVSDISVGYGFAPQSIMGAVKFTAAELSPYVGRTLTEVSFLPRGSSASQVSVIVDFGSRRVLTYPVEATVFNAMNHVDISDCGIVIPSGQDVYIGYAVKDSDSSYPLAGDNGPYVKNGFFTSSYSESFSSWEVFSELNIVVSAKLSQAGSDLDLLGIDYIMLKDEPYHVGDVFVFDLRTGAKHVDRVRWYLDGVEQSSDSAVLGKGLHSITATVTLRGGLVEELEMEINVD